MQAEQRQSIALAVVRWGFGATIVLSLVIGIFSSADIQMTRHKVRTIVSSAARPNVLAVEIGRQATRLRALALELTVVREADRRALEDQFRAANFALDEALREMKTLLEPEDLPTWRHLLPELALYRSRIAEAVDTARRGDGQRAQVILGDEARPLAAIVQQRLDVLTNLNEEQGRTLLADSDRRLARMRFFQTALDVALVLGLVSIWWFVLQTLRRHGRELAVHMNRIEHSNRDLDAFAGRIAHDLRNTLAPLTFIAARLRSPGHRPEALERIAGQLESAVRQSRSLIDGLLAFSRAADRSAAPGSASLAAAVGLVVEELGPLAARVDATVQLQLEDADVACPPILLHLVAVNLVGNALKFLEGRPRRAVSISTGAVDGCGVLTVGDSGPGIAADALPHIFEPFYRAPGVSAAGTGIGLATVRRIVDVHGGQISVDSELGRGSVFCVRLPLREAPPAREPPARAAGSHQPYGPLR